MKIGIGSLFALMLVASPAAAQQKSLRDQIVGAGYVVEDTPAGAVVRPA